MAEDKKWYKDLKVLLEEYDNGVKDKDGKFTTLSFVGLSEKNATEKAAEEKSVTDFKKTRWWRYCTTQKRLGRKK